MEIIFTNENTISCIFDDVISETVNSQVIRLKQALEELDLPEVNEVVVSYNTVTIYFDDYKTTHAELKDKLTRLSVQSSTAQKRRIFVVPVCYDKDYALDLEELAMQTHLSEEEVVKRHTGRPYLVYMLGFMPGFPFLGGLDKSIAMPRRKQPRKRIPAGSVGIAGEQTGMYPLESPGGWNIIGRTPVKLFEADRQPEVYYEAGDYIQFKAITEQEFLAIEEDAAYQLEVREAE
ncbi:5-oxoprolinase subunit PxpB [Macrococcus lamae]|uniref:5-oxoprolinase subunit PxpB n=1 Tax=Macrococcus lamae TaxID=198484 RepID=A0A4R6BTT4_9STAP|nr:5-oxoprolinase subunit PxpB [Macrococcus lamae]TDM10503.1 5-oxoprolinase subunit PxpB [Macrococcus lamae]